MGSGCSCFRQTYELSSRDYSLGHDDVIMSESPSLKESFHFTNDVTSGDQLDTPPRSASGDGLVRVDLNVALNSAQHRTQLYQVHRPGGEQLVVRRGQSFLLIVTVNPGSQRVWLVLETGSNPHSRDGSRLMFPLSSNSTVHGWSAVVVSRRVQAYSMQMTPPSGCPVARWSLSLLEVWPDTSQVLIPITAAIYTIYNPWNQADGVHLSDEAQLAEYLLNPAGVMYQGTERRPAAKYWNYGQFASIVLDCVLGLLDRGQLSHQQRGNAALVSRTLAALTNSADDNGVIVGDWSGAYSSGTSPLAWVGSIAILQQYHAMQYPVKYGQCWVFAGVLTTLCRSVGLPCRPVTCYSSAHDCDSSLTVDVHWAAGDHSRREDLSCDSVWNFHVWNEVWLWRRGDLPAAGFGGWQVVDATPQEASAAGGAYTTGPAPTAAVRQGLVALPYDTDFVYAEVNADLVHWLIQDDGTKTELQRDTDVIGKLICTKSLYGDQYVDITNSYKAPEGSSSERLSFNRAVGSVTSLPGSGVNREHVVTLGNAVDEGYNLGSSALVNAIVVDDNVEDAGHVNTSVYEEAGMKLVTSESVNVGDDVTVSVKVENKCSYKEISLAITLSISAVYYTGAFKNFLLQEKQEITLKPLQALSLMERRVTRSSYLPYLSDHYELRVTASALVGGTNRWVMDTDIIPIVRQNIQMKICSAETTIVANQNVDLQLTFTNPLPVSMTNITWFLEFGSVAPPIEIDSNCSVKPGASLSHTAHVVFPSAGHYVLMAGLQSRELNDITGHMDIQVL